MKKSGLLLFLLALISFQVSAQIKEPVKWKTSYEKVDDDEYIIVFDATIDDGWKVYGTEISDNGPIPTSIVLEKADGAEAVGSAVGVGKAYQEHEPVFDMELTFYKERATFKQRVKLNKSSARVSGFLEYMTCDAESCIFPPEVPFDFNLTANISPTEDNTTGNNNTPGDEDTAEATADEQSVDEDTTSGPTFSQAPEKLDTDENKEEEKESLWGYFLLGLGGGMLALVTPCVFPMIPLTVSFFTKRSKSRKKGLLNAIIYALSIIIIFVGLGFLITLIFGPDKLNAMASNIYFNLIFFVVFIVFALSFFGAFELTLPSSFINKADSASEKGGLLGIFFMAFTLVLVSFSCTAPIVGSLLVLIAESNAVMSPLIGMLGFSLALALPFALFAAFPGWLNSLPKSGGWLNTVKVTLGFVELALALKFLSVVDLAYHWNFLSRDIFIALWIIIAGLLGFYLLGKITFPHESKVEHISITRLFFAILALGFAIYMIPGLWGAPVKLLSGIAPPTHYQEFNLHQLKYQNKKLQNQMADLSSGGMAAQENLAEIDLEGIGIPKSENMECPHEFDCYFDLERGLTLAKVQEKPLLVDFTGWSCVNCRKMEEYVWSDPRIWEMINENYILVSLYVDDKTELPEEHQVSHYTKNRVRTVGKLWSDLQIEKYQINSQPYYVLLDHNQNVLVKPPKGYTPSVQEYLAYLEAGVKEFERRQKGLQAELKK